MRKTDDHKEQPGAPLFKPVRDNVRGVAAGHANIATTRIDDRRRMQPGNSPTFKVSD